MSGGTEGGMAPHWLVFERRPGDAEDFPGAALAVGRAHTTQLPTEHLGRIDQARMVAEGVATAMKDAGITNADDVCVRPQPQKPAEADEADEADDTYQKAPPPAWEMSL